MADRNSTKPPNISVRPRGSVLPRLHADDGTEITDVTETVIAKGAGKASRPREALTVLVGLDASHTHFLAGSATTWIGRGADCALRLRDRGVSRHHVRIERSQHHYVLHDNQARNGTFVNGRRVTEHHLRPGDEIQLGPNVSLLFSFASGDEARLAQQRAAREQLLHEHMVAGRIESLANIVTGLAHEINTPLGVATTANALIASLVDEVRRTGRGPAFDALLSELGDATSLMSANLARACRLVRNFKQLSARQLSDEYLDCDLAEVIRDSLTGMDLEMKTRKIIVRTSWESGERFPWKGFPGHLAQIIVGMIQNVLRYAYSMEEEGKIDIRLSAERDDYRLEFQDYGAGMAADILPKVFEPFVTSGRKDGAAGLGLAIAHNIVTNIFAGDISCSSKAGRGTKFVLTFPRVCPGPAEEATRRPSVLTQERRGE